MPHESTLQAAFLLRAPERFPDELRLFRRNVVVAQRGGRNVRAGIAGQSDLYAYVRGGRCLEIELKGLRTPVSPEQRAWAAWCESWGVPHLLLRAAKGETTEQTVERWCDELQMAVKKLTT